MDHEEMLSTLAQIFTALPACTKLEEVLRLRTQARETLHDPLFAGESLSTRNQGQAVVFFCERRAGQLLAALHLRGGDRRAVSSTRRRPTSARPMTITEIVSAIKIIDGPRIKVIDGIWGGLSMEFGVA
jgi:hypothetical protein